MIDPEIVYASVAKRLNQWKEEGILEEKLKEYGFVFEEPTDTLEEPTDTSLEKSD